MSAYYKIVKTTWNVLLDRYESMELGNLSTTLAEALGVTSGDSGTKFSIKRGTYTGTTSAVGTLAISGLTDFNTIVGLLSSSVSGSCYMVQYDGATYGIFGYDAPHYPLVSAEVTITFMYI